VAEARPRAPSSMDITNGLNNCGRRYGCVMDVFPDFDGLAGIGDLREVVGALLMFALVIAVLMLIVSAIIWAVSSSTGNYAAASKGRVGVLVSLGGAVLAGAGVAWMNWLISIGQQL